MNTGASFVRKRRSIPGASAALDRRVRRTQRSLVHALIGLLRERRYESITIQDLLDRADIGRSTFYSHYRGKDDFLLRSFEALIDQLDGCIAPGDARLVPVRELFAHVGAQGEFFRALARARMLDRVLQAGIERVSTTIERRLAERADRSPSVPAALVARAHAGALFALLRWWIEQDSPLRAERMDAMYHAIIGGDRMPSFACSTR